jgi:cation:H+ antiporter
VNPVEALGAELSVSASVALLVASAAALLAAGTRFARTVDRLADRLGIGEALAGAVLLGASTSIPGLIVTVLAAADARPDFAASNALGGIAAQTMFLALADLAYRPANLEHAAASLATLMQTVLVSALIALVLLAAVGPDVALLGVHPASVALPLVYVYGLWLSKHARDAPMWRPRETSDTRLDVPDAENLTLPLGELLMRFAALAFVVGLCGVAVATAGIALVERTELSGTLVGGLFTSVVTSLPELVTAIAAVRAGALQLAVGDIVGGNAFDVLFLSAADVAFRGGSIYAVLGRETLFLLALTLLLTAIFAAGLLHRERRGIGFEGAALLVVYALGFVLISTMG